MAMLQVIISQVCDESRPAVLSALAGFGAEQVEDNKVRVLEAEVCQVVTVLQKALAGSGYVAVENMQY